MIERDPCLVEHFVKGSTDRFKVGVHLGDRFLSQLLVLRMVDFFGTKTKVIATSVRRTESSRPTSVYCVSCTNVVDANLVAHHPICNSLCPLVGTPHTRGIENDRVGLGIVPSTQVPAFCNLQHIRVSPPTDGNCSLCRRRSIWYGQ